MTMPKSGITVESCILTKWNVKVGDKVKVGDVLFAYETDKSSFEAQAEFEGEILATFFNEGDEVPVGENMVIIGNHGEDISAFTAGTAVAFEEPKEAPATKAEVSVIPEGIEATPVTMPKSGITVESCILTKFDVKVGDTVKIGDAIFSYETDKSSFDAQAEVEGEVLAIFYAEGDEVPVGDNVMVIGKHGVDASCFKNGGASVVEEQPKVQEIVAEVKAVENKPAPTVNNDGRIFASPRAKNLANKLGVDLESAVGTGPNGRIIESDVRKASVNAPIKDVAVEKTAEIKAPVDVKAFKDEKMTTIRKAIAKNMMASLSSMAQLTHTLSFDCTNVMAFRKYLKDNAEKLGLPSITLNNIIVFAISRVILKHKVLNAHLINGDTLRYFEHANIGIATDTPKGLIVPTLFGADTMSLSEIAVKSKQLSKDAVDGKLSPDLMTGGTFTVSNLGTLGIESFTPVINPPQTGILGVNTMETRVKIGDRGEIVPYTAMGLSLTYDHRALDGAPASKFLKDLKDYLENFSFNLLADAKAI